jgi:hypothetical protein
MSHQFDALTQYCVTCGAAKLDAEARSWECVDPEASKVSAISHIVRGRRLRAIVEKELCRG